MSGGSDLWTIAPWSLYGLGWAAVVLALFKGQWEERVFAVVQAGFIALDAATEYRAFGAHLGHEPAHDLFNLALSLALALRSQKVWPLAAASISLAMVMTEAAQLLARVDTPAYAIAQGVWEVLLDAVLATGAVAAWRARQARARLGGSP